MTNVVLYNTKLKEYPINYSPDINYPEYIFSHTKISKENKVYESIRNMFYLSGYDKENYNTKKWNPLKNIIKENDVEFIKPNIVNHINELQDESFLCVTTNASIIRCIVDYVLIALNNTGKIIIGDSPMQSCDFEEAINKNGLKDVIDFYHSNNINNISLIDLRKEKNEVKINLKDKSKHYNNKNKYKRYTVTNYNPKEIKKYHNQYDNIYCLSKTVMESDVIIDLPKIKTHRKAGFTAAMKNFIGVITTKECLPHHTKGSKTFGGDEYLNFSFLKSMKGYFYDKRIIAEDKNSKLYKYYNKIYRTLAKKDSKGYFEGSWYGNDTLWRTIIDVYNCILYGNKIGELKNNPQRRILTIADMIIAGEKEGPLMPTKKTTGYLLMSEDCYCLDKTICKIIGFETKIPYINNYDNENKIEILSNEKELNKKDLKDVSLNLKFIPANGWKEIFERIDI